MQHVFRKIAQWTSRTMGSAWAFVVAICAILLWACTGPFFGFSTTWQLIVNTGTTILTFLMVFLIQNTQNRDAQAIHLKLDEIIKALDPARNDLIDIEEREDIEIEQYQKEFRELRNIKNDEPNEIA